MLMMRLGPFVFAIPTFSVESMSHEVSGRVAEQAVLGAPPPTHLLGPGGETRSLSSTFYPFHMNGGGLAQLAAVKEACRKQIPMMLVSLSGLVMDRWVIESVSNEESQYHPNGMPQSVTVTLNLKKYVGNRGSNAGLPSLVSIF